MLRALPMNVAWVELVKKILSHGYEVLPRGQKTLELPQQTLVLDMQYSVLTIAERKLNYKFMVAEALWMLEGSDLVAPLAKYNKRMLEFSDDGVHLQGAYGPRIEQQLEYVVNTLWNDFDTRQATLTTWQRNPGASKDIPCTVAMSFMLRPFKNQVGHESHQLQMHVYMRSSDVWLGVPYDVFSFAAVARLVCAKLNAHLVSADSTQRIGMGNMYITAASSHLYEQHWDKAAAIVDGEQWAKNPDWHEGLALSVNTTLGFSNSLKEELQKDLDGEENVWKVVRRG